LWQELSWNGNEIDDWRSLINANPSRTESKPVRVEFQGRKLDVQVINDSSPSQSIDVDLDGALSDRGGQRDDQHDDKHRDEENSSPTGVEIHWYYRAWEPTLLFNDQQATAFQLSQLDAGIRANKMSVPGVGDQLLGRRIHPRYGRVLRVQRYCRGPHISTVLFLQSTRRNPMRCSSSSRVSRNALDRHSYPPREDRPLDKGMNFAVTFTSS